MYFNLVRFLQKVILVTWSFLAGGVLVKGAASGVRGTDGSREQSGRGIGRCG